MQKNMARKQAKFVPLLSKTEFSYSIVKFRGFQANYNSELREAGNLPGRYEFFLNQGRSIVNFTDVYLDALAGEAFCFGICVLHLHFSFLPQVPAAEDFLCLILYSPCMKSLQLLQHNTTIEQP